MLHDGTKNLSGEPEVIEKETGNKEATATTTTGSALPKGAKQVVELALSPEGGPAQDIALREFGRILVASAADSVSTIFSAPLRALEEVEKTVPKEILTPLAPAHLALKSLSEASQVSSKDAETLEIARELTSLIADQSASSSSETTPPKRRRRRRRRRRNQPTPNNERTMSDTLDSHPCQHFLRQLKKILKSPPNFSKWRQDSLPAPTAGASPPP